MVIMVVFAFKMWNSWNISDGTTLTFEISYFN